MSAASAPMSREARTRGNSLRSLLGSQEVVLALSLVLLLVVVDLINPRYLAENNVKSIFLGNAYIGVMAVGMTMVIVSGNIDISVGSLVGVLATISGTLAIHGAPIWVAWLAPLVFGALAGALTGFFVAYLRIPSIVVTLGMLSILKGGLIIATNGAWITNLPPDYFLAQQKIVNIPMPVIFMIGLTILGAFFMRYTALGRSIYAVGGNAEAARLSGINVRGVLMRVFILNGVIVGIASVLFATQLQIIQSTTPPGLELVVITAAVVGGVSILGGTGTVIGSTLAAILLSAIGSALIFVSLSAYWLQAVQGTLILVTVLIDLARRRRQRIQMGR
jgi:ribose/xylose/arabinose/galactoside ABC-type transport system permease subunit